MIGLAGAHRTGKTTLADVWGESRDVEFVDIKTLAVMEKMGIQPKDITTIDMRLKLQREVVNACRDTFVRRKGTFISDRTPYDVAAYTLADASMDMTVSQQEQMNEIVEDCFEIANMAFQVIVLIYPGIPYVPAPGKPPFNESYQNIIHTLVLGFLSDARNRVNWFHMPRNFTDMDDRIISLDGIYEHATRRDQTIMKIVGTN